MSIETTQTEMAEVVCDSCHRHVYMAIVFAVGYGRVREEHFCIRCVKEMMSELENE